MKYYFYFVSIFILTSCNEDVEKHFHEFDQKHIQTDLSFIKNVKVDSIIVGYSTISDIKNLGYDIEELDSSQMSSLIKEYKRQGDRFFIENKKQIIIGTFDYTEIISSIWLLEKYKGKLLSKNINLENYTVENMIFDYPNFDWSTDGFANYWFYSNNINHDTTVFFINIDTTIAQFPLDKNHYMNHEIGSLKIEMSPWSIYGQKYGKLDTVYVKPMYSPLNIIHSNYYLERRKAGIKTTIKEITTFGKKSIYEQIKIGKWMNYNADHTLKSIEYYNKGKLIKKE